MSPENASLPIRNDYFRVLTTGTSSRANLSVTLGQTKISRPRWTSGARYETAKEVGIINYNIAQTKDPVTGWHLFNVF